MGKAKPWKIGNWIGFVFKVRNRRDWKWLPLPLWQSNCFGVQVWFLGKRLQAGWSGPDLESHRSHKFYCGLVR